MPYYDTLAEDIRRAKEIITRGLPGADTYAACKLLESFVAALEPEPEPPPVETDIRLRAQIAEAAEDPWLCVTLIYQYYRDPGRAVRASQSLVLQHMGMLAGAELKEQRARQGDPDPAFAPEFYVALTASQRMALIDVISAVMVPPLRMQVYVDVLRNVETTPSTLLRLVMDAEPVR